MVASAARKKRRQSSGLSGRTDSGRMRGARAVPLRDEAVDYAALATRLMAQASREPINQDDTQSFINAALSPLERSRRKALMFGSLYGAPMRPTAKCYWCGASALWLGRVPACAVHRVDGEALTDALSSVRWSRSRRFTASWRASAEGRDLSTSQGAGSIASAPPCSTTPSPGRTSMKDCLFCRDYVPDKERAVRLAGLLRCPDHEEDAEALLTAVSKVRWRDGPPINPDWWGVLRRVRRDRQNNWRIFK